MIERLPDWRARLRREIDAARARRFRLARFDCCQFAANCVVAVCNRDPLAGWERDAYLRAYKGGRIGVEIDSAMAAIGARQDRPQFATAGDLIIMTAETHDEAPGIVVAGGRVATVAPDGFGFVDLRDAVRAWRI